MLSRLLTVFRIPELRQKIILTLILLAVYRLGYSLFLPIVDQAHFADIMKRSGGGTFGQIMQTLSLFSASSLGNATIFGLGIMPYISASIIFQLLGTVYPPLEAMQKEGEAGRKKINEYTRYATVIIAFGQSFFWIRLLLSQGSESGGSGLLLAEYSDWYYQLMAAFMMTAGTVLLMWIGEQIDEYGIGNGISLLIMAGILARMPNALGEILAPAFQSGRFNIKLGSDAGVDKLLLLCFLFVAVIVGVVAITQAQRRIPIQSAKHVRGRRVLGGSRQFLPLRLNQSGVMPIIFASSLLVIPQMIFGWIAQIFPSQPWIASLSQLFGQDRGFVYNVSYILLIYFFAYFWTSITFNPKEMADNLKDYGSFVPGYRPGQRTAEYLDDVMHRVTYVGAGALSLIAIVPTIMAAGLNINPLVASFYGGTGLMIVVSVALDIVQKIDSHLVMRNKGGLLEADENL